MALLGIDVSHFQGAIDWPRTGVAFAFAKATEGSTFRDGRFAANIAGMRAAGIVPGAYHFLTGGNPAAQADSFCQATPSDVIHALDVEASSLDVAGWVKQYRLHYPTKPLLIYTGRDLWARAGGGSGASFGPLWAAGYLPNRYLPGGSLASVAGQIGDHRGGVPFAGWDHPMFLQFTDAATVPGVSGPVDGDIFYGTRADLDALAQPNLIPAKEPDMDLTTTFALTAGEAADLNSNLPKPQYKEGDTIDVRRALGYGGPGIERLYHHVRMLEAGLSALTTAVNTLAGNDPAAITAAFDAGRASLADELARVRVVVTTDPSA